MEKKTHFVSMFFFCKESNPHDFSSLSKLELLDQLDEICLVLGYEGISKSDQLSSWR